MLADIEQAERAVHIVLTERAVHVVEPGRQALGIHAFSYALFEPFCRQLCEGPIHSATEPALPVGFACRKGHLDHFIFTLKQPGRLCLRIIRTASPVAPFIDARMRVALCLCRGVPRDRVSLLPDSCSSSSTLPLPIRPLPLSPARRCDRDARSDHTNRHQRRWRATTPRTAIGRVWRRRRRARRQAGV